MVTLRYASMHRPSNIITFELFATDYRVGTRRGKRFSRQLSKFFDIEIKRWLVSSSPSSFFLRPGVKLHGDLRRYLRYVCMLFEFFPWSSLPISSRISASRRRELSRRLLFLYTLYSILRLL